VYKPAGIEIDEPGRKDKKVLIHYDYQEDEFFRHDGNQIRLTPVFFIKKMFRKTNTIMRDGYPN